MLPATNKKAPEKFGLLFLFVIRIITSYKKNETEPTPTNSEDKTTTSQLEIKNTESGYNFSLVLPKRDKMSSEYAQKKGEITSV